MKQKIHSLLNENKSVIKFIYILIVLNIVAIILESYQELRDNYQIVFQVFEVFSVVIFTIEYVLRLWSADYQNEGKPFLSRMKFATSTAGIIDLLAILPFYLPMFIALDLRVVRVLRLLRMLRIFKLGRFSKSLQTINEVFKETKADLSITLFVTAVLLVLSSTLMYYFEKGVQPDKFDSIGQAFWWSIATLTTVGYGDVYPVTAIGKVLSALIALIGIGFVALPTGIISSAFIDKLHKKNTTTISCQCPNCGHQFEQTTSTE